MSRTAKTWLIVAGVLVVLGPILIVIGAAAGGVNFSGEGNYETKTYEITATFDQIAVTTDITDIELAAADEKQCKVVCDEAEGRENSAEVQDGTLVIKSQDNRQWFDRLVSFSMRSPKIRVYLPQKMYSSLTIDTDTGDVIIPQGMEFGKAEIKGDTSDVSCLADIKDSVEINCGTGDVVLGGKLGTATVTTSTGDIDIMSADSTADISINTDTGDVTMKTVNCSGLELESTTGDQTLTDVVASGDMNIRSTTGDVVFEHSDAENITVNTTTGDVTGTLRTDKIFSTDTATGDVNVQSAANGGKCEIKTSTGDITISVSK